MKRIVWLCTIVLLFVCMTACSDSSLKDLPVSPGNGINSDTNLEEEKSDDENGGDWTIIVPGRN